VSDLKTIDDQAHRTTVQPQTYETSFRVRYAETDQMGVVYHSNLIIWFEVGRVEMMRQLGFTYLEMEQEGGTHLPVVDVRCRYKAPARYDDIVVVRTRLVNVRESLLHFGYEILRDQDGTLLAEGESVHMVVDSGFKRVPLSQKYLPAFLKAAGKVPASG
jgi:acyl-CoA thioester hydrolase